MTVLSNVTQMRVVDTTNDESSTATLAIEVTPGKTRPILHAIKTPPENDTIQSKQGQSLSG